MAKRQAPIFLDMLKKIILYFVVTFLSQPIFAQVLYSERFNNLSLTTATFSSGGSTQTYLYSDVPSSMTAINGATTTADTLGGNYPFKANGQKQKAWLSYRPASITNTTDTFAVSTSWLNPIGTVDSWLITPLINNISANSVLTWNAIAPDANNRDGYMVYVSTNSISSTPVTSDFNTTLLSVNSENNNWTTRGLSLAAFAGKNIRIAFRNNSTNKFQLWLDDIVVENITNTFDAKPTSNDVYKYSTININNFIKATFKNNGSSAINNLVVNYQIGTNPIVTNTLTLSSPLQYLDSRQLTFYTPFVSSTPGYYTYKIWASAINGQADQNLNDTITGAITLCNASVPKKTLIEEFTGANYGWAPENQEALKSIATTNTNVIIASIHADDSLSTTDGNSLVADYTNSLPSASIDQYYFLGEDVVALQKVNWSNSITQRQSVTVPVAVAITNPTYNPTTRQIDATVEATFAGDVKGDYRLNLYIKENNVYGPIGDYSDNDWNQYSYLYNVPTSPFYQLGTYLNNNMYLLGPSEYKHQYVVNHMAGGAYGTAGIIPTNGTTISQTYTMSYSYILPTNTNNGFRYNFDNIYLIGLVTEYNADTKQRAVLNASQVKLNNNNELQVGVNDLAKTLDNVSVYPNPATNYFVLNYSINQAQTVSVTIYNTLGELVGIETLNTNPGNVSHRLNIEHLPQGSYTIVIASKESTISKKLTIIK